MNMKKGFIILLAIGLIFAVVGCNDSGDVSSALDKDTLIVGTSADFPPFENVDENGDIVGFDIDLIQEIGKELGKEIKIENMDFNGIVGAVQTDKVDIAISGITADEERGKKVNFSDPYYESSQAILVREDDEGSNSMDDLSGKLVGSQLGSTSDDVIMEYEDIENKKYNKANDAVLDLTNGRLDAVIIEHSIAQAFVDNNEGIKVIVPEGLNTEKELLAIALPKDDEELLNKVNEALASIKDSGKYDELFNKWFQD